MHKRASEDKTPSEARPFSVCGWLCGQRQKPEFKSSRIVAKAKENIRFSSEKRMFCGADRQIRTADLILTNAKVSFFLIFFDCLWLFPFQTGCFLALLKHGISGCSGPACGCLCGQRALLVQVRQQLLPPVQKGSVSCSGLGYCTSSGAEMQSIF